MLAGEREFCGVVIERGTRPLCGGVARFASLRETGGDVVRARRFLEICQMAGNTCRRQCRVLVVYMACGTSN